MPVELPELVVTSKTQSAAKIKEILESQGYATADFEVESTSDTAAPPAEPVVETPPTEVPAGAPPAGDDDDNEEVAEAPAGTPADPPAPGSAALKPKTGSARNKEKLRASVEENLRLKAELEELRQQQAPPAPAATVPAAAEAPAPEAEPEAPVAPKWGDFENEEDQLAAFTLASARFAVVEDSFNKGKQQREQHKTEAPAREAAQRAAAEQTQVFEKWMERTTPVKERHSDFDQKIAAIPPTPVMASVVMREEDGPELAYWLADNPDELLQLNAATKTDATSTPAQVQSAMGKMHQALGRIRYILSQEGTPGDEPNREVPPTPTSQVTQPPPAAAPAGTPPPKKPSPVAPVGARGSSPNKTLAQMTQEELRNMHPDEYRRRHEKGERYN